MKMQNKIKTRVETTDEVENSIEIKKLLILVLVVTAIFFIFYGITILVLKKDKEDSKKEDIVTQIDFNKVLVSQLLEQPEENYYVLLTIENDANKTTYDSLIEEYYKIETHKKIYYANLNDPLNKSFMGDKTSLEGNVKDFKFDKSTLVEIESGSIKSIYEGSTDILEHLNSIR